MKIVSTFFLFAILVSLSLAFTNGPGEGLKIGDKASDFNLLGVNGDFTSLSDYKDANGFIVIFTCNHCPYSKMYEDRIIDLHNKYADQGFPVIAINPNDPEVQPADSYDKMVERSNSKKFPFPYVFDKGQTVYPVYGAKKTPHVFILDNEMIVKYIGAIDNNPRNPSAVTVNYVETAIEAMKAGKEIPEDMRVTKAIGCTIKVKAS